MGSLAFKFLANIELIITQEEKGEDVYYSHVNSEDAMKACIRLS